MRCRHTFGLKLLKIQSSVNFCELNNSFYFNCLLIEIIAKIERNVSLNLIIFFIFNVRQYLCSKFLKLNKIS